MERIADRDFAVCELIQNAGEPIVEGEITGQGRFEKDVVEFIDMGASLIFGVAKVSPSWRPIEDVDDERVIRRESTVPKVIKFSIRTLNCLFIKEGGRP